MYGIDDKNFCGKTISCARTANTLLPLSYLLYAKDNDKSIVVCSAKNGVYRTNVNYIFPRNVVCIETEKTTSCQTCIHPPPNDLFVALDDNAEIWLESKVVMNKRDRTELILRQDCYSCNCLHNIFRNNPSLKHANVQSLVEDNRLNEAPYLILLRWVNQDSHIRFDCVVFTDLQLLRFIVDAKTERCMEAVKLINKSLDEKYKDGKMTYKPYKKSTVAHQKVSIYPFHIVKTLEKELNYTNTIVRESDLITNIIRPETNLWHEIEKCKLVQKIKQQKNQLP